jgi:hypothetical protein
LDLRPREWRSLRRRFYVLVERHLLTPRGFFDYTAYLHRVFGLMVACGDFAEVNRFLDRFKKVVGLLRSTTTAGTSDRVRFRLCLTYYCGKFFETALAATTVDRFSKWTELRMSLRRVVAIGRLAPHIQSRLSLRDQSRQLLLSDLGRRPYKEYWFFNQAEDLPGPRVPPDIAVRRLIRLGGVRKFRELAELKMPFWPALAFPTRPLSVAEIGLIAPRLLGEAAKLRDAVMALRGARVPPNAPVGLTKDGADTHAHFLVPDSSKRKPRVAVTSVRTSDAQWKSAVAGKPDHSLKRYQSLRRLINQVLGERPRARYVVLPECSFPLRWAVRLAAKLAQNRVSFLAGLEYYYDRKRRKLRNDCLVSLTTTWPGYPTNVVRLQPKLAPAHKESAYLKKHAKYPLYEPTGADALLPIYLHGNFFFGILLCSDLTNIENRRYFQGAVDALFVLEWNPDVRTFSFLIEATAHDIHAFVVQINNRTYGDSRIRAPYRDEHKRDLVRVKGGLSDYYVISSIEHERLRQFQRSMRKAGDRFFKPLPIGFQMSSQRRHIRRT